MHTARPLLKEEPAECIFPWHVLLQKCLRDVSSWHARRSLPTYASGCWDASSEQVGDGVGGRWIGARRGRDQQSWHVPYPIQFPRPDLPADLNQQYLWCSWFIGLLELTPGQGDKGPLTRGPLCCVFLMVFFNVCFNVFFKGFFNGTSISGHLCPLVHQLIKRGKKLCPNHVLEIISWYVHQFDLC